MYRDMEPSKHWTSGTSYPTRFALHSLVSPYFITLYLVCRYWPERFDASTIEIGNIIDLNRYRIGLYREIVSTRFSRLPISYIYRGCIENSCRLSISNRTASTTVQQGSPCKAVVCQGNLTALVKERLPCLFQLWCYERQDFFDHHISGYRLKLPRPPNGGTPTINTLPGISKSYPYTKIIFRSSVSYRTRFPFDVRHYVYCNIHQVAYDA